MAQFLSITLFILLIWLNLSLTLTSKVSDFFSGSFIVGTSKSFPSFDKELNKFTEVFAHSSAGSLLTSIIKVIPKDNQYRLKNKSAQSSSFISQEFKNQQYPYAVQPTSPLEGINIGPPQRNSTILTSFITILLLVVAFPFVWLVIFGGDDLVCIKAIVAISAYGLGILTLAIFYGSLPDWLLCLVALLIGVTYGIFYYNTCNIEEIIMVIFIFSSMLAASFIYNIYAVLPFESINPSYCGFAGLIFNSGIFDHYFVFLRLTYFLIIITIAFCIYVCVPESVKSLSIMPDKGQNSSFVDYIFCFCAAWPCAGLLTQIFYLTGLATFNPIEPLSFFYVPCQFRWNRWETYFALLAWGLITEIIREIRSYNGQGTELPISQLSRRIVERWDYAASQ